MSAALATTEVPKGALSALASRLDIDPDRMSEVLKATAFKACKNDEQFAALVIVANTYGLNPLLKELYAFPGKGGEIVPIVSIDGWLRIINDHPQMDGMSDHWADDGSWCEVTIHRKDRKHPTIHREHLEEVRRGTEPWKQHPRRMLKWKTIIQTGRIAFGFGGIHDEEEGQVAAMRTASGHVVEDEPQAEENPFGKISGNGESDAGRAPQQPSEPEAEVAADDGDSGQEVSSDSPTPKERPAGKLIAATYLDCSKKTGETKGKKWTRYGFKLSLGDAEFWAGTFSGSLGRLGFAPGTEVAVIVEKKGEHYELLWIEGAPAQKGGLV